MFEPLEPRIMLAAEDLDPTFDGDGLAITDFGDVSRVFGIAVQNDDKIVAVGERSTGSNTSQFAVARYNVDGTLDNSFGSGGLVTTTIGDSLTPAKDVVVQADGKIVVVGYTLTPGDGTVFAMTRYNADGTLDESFGQQGQRRTVFPGASFARATSVALQRDGKIVVAGNAAGQEFALARYTANGNLDTSFGTQGRVTEGFGSNFAGAEDLVIQPDGKLVVVGFSDFKPAKFTVARFNADGSLDDGGPSDSTPDDSFGTDGHVAIDIPIGGDFRRGEARGVELQADGKIVVAGSAGDFSGPEGQDIAVMRFNADGSLDDNGPEDATPGDRFGTSGIVTTDLGGLDLGHDVAIVPGGKILLAGGSNPGGFSVDSDFALALYDPTGILDPTFDNDGIVRTDIDNGSFDSAHSVALDGAGRLIIGGATGNSGGETHFAIARYQGFGTTNQRPDAVDDNRQTDDKVAIDINVLSNDSDPDSDSLTIEHITQPANGQVTFNADGTLRYTPRSAIFGSAAFVGIDRFAYQISDGNFHHDSATVTVTVNDVNEPPEIFSPFGDPVTIRIGPFTQNGDRVAIYRADDPEDGSNLTVTLTDDAGGRFRLAFDGLGAFHALLIEDLALLAPDQPLTHQITIRAEDSGGLSVERDFTININHVPEAGNDAFATLRNTPLVIDVSSGPELLQNPGGEEPLAAGQIPGWVEVQGNWTRRTFSPAPRDGSAYFAVSSRSDAELAQDVDVSAFAAEIDAGEQGFGFRGFSRIRNLPGTDDTAHIIVEYRDALGAVLDTFVDIEFFDSWGEAADVRVAPAGTRTIRVRLLDNERNSGRLDDVFFDALSLRPFNPTAPSILANDSDPNGEPFRITQFFTPPNGTVTDNLDGTITYTPAADFTGTDSFGYEIIDPPGARVTGVVKVNVQDVEAPDLVVSSFTVPGETLVGNPATAEVSWTVKNIGLLATGDQWTDRVVLSSDNILGDDDDQVLADFPHTGALDPGESYAAPETHSVTLPENLNGQFFLYLTTDVLNEVDEPGGGETNNDTPLTAIDVERPFVDLIVPSVTVDPTTVPAGELLTVTWQVRNDGNITTDVDSWSDRIVLSTNQFLTAIDIQLAVVPHNGTLAAGAAYTETAQVTLPGDVIGDVHIFVVTDTLDQVDEMPESNNAGRTVSPITITLPPHADLVVSSFTAPTDLQVGNPVTIEVSWSVTNEGDAPTEVAQWTDRLILSDDQVLGDGDDKMLSEVVHNGTLGAGASYTNPVTVSVTFPEDLAGQFFLFLQTDATDQVEELVDEGNNASDEAPITVTPPYADLAVEAVFAPPTGPREGQSGRPLEVAWRVRNQGLVPTSVDSWVDRIVLSDDAVLDGGDTQLALVTHNGTLAVDENYIQTAEVILLNGIEGDFHIFVQTDFAEQVFEFTFLGNNPGRTPAPLAVTLTPPPDLQVTDITGPTEAQPGQSITVSWTVSNTGLGPAEAPWMDRVYLSPNETLIGARHLGSVRHDNNLAHQGAGGVFTDMVSAVFVVPRSLSDGDYRILVQTDSSDDVYEHTNEDNNLLAGSEILSIGHPDLVAAFTTSPATAASGGTLSVAWDVTNNGTFPALGTWRDRVYLSTDETIILGSSGDTLLGEFEHTGPLAAGGTETFTAQVDLVMADGISGDFFLLVQTDFDDDVEELVDENNNVTSLPLSITLSPYPDLEVSAVTVEPIPDIGAPGNTTVVLGDPAQIRLIWQVSNVGQAQGRTGSWVDRVIASPDETVGNFNDVVLAEFPNVRPLAAGGDFYSRDESFQLPPGMQDRFHFFVQTDANGDVFELNRETNNVAEASMLVDVVKSRYADLIVLTATGDAAGQSGQPINIEWTVLNDPAQAIGLTVPSTWDDHVQLARNADGTDIVELLGSFQHIGAIDVGDSYQRRAEITLPHGISGRFYMVVHTARGGGPFEFVYTDNNSAVFGPINVTLSPSPDLVVEDIVVPPGAVFADSTIDITWTVRNSDTQPNSGGDAAGSWTDAVELREVGGTSVVKVGTFRYSGGLQAGKSYLRTEQFTLPENLEGVYQVAIETNAPDPRGKLFEFGTLVDNNTTLDADPLTVQLPPRPDLQVSMVTAPDTVQAGSTASVEFIVVNQGTAAASGRWKDRVVLSLDNVVTGDDFEIGELDNGSALLPGEEYRTTISGFPISKAFRGDIFLLVRTDEKGHVNEFPNDDNNTFAFPITVIPIPPSDLVTSTVVAPELAFLGSTFEVRFTVTNLGPQETNTDTWFDSVWLTRDRNRPHPGSGGTPQDFLLATFPHTGGLEGTATALGGESYEQIVNVTIPERYGNFILQPGEYFITPFADAYDNVIEDTLAININPDDPNELDNNNYKARPITVIGTPSFVNLAVTDVVAPAQAVGGDLFTVSWTVENRGTEPTALESWDDSVFLSTLSDPNQLNARVTGFGLGHVRHDGVLEPGASYTVEYTFQLTSEMHGLNVIVTTLRPSEEPFDLRSDNVGSDATNVTDNPADLQVTSVQTLSPQHFSGEPTTIQWTVENIGNPVWSGTEYWRDLVFFSPDATFDKNRATFLDRVTYSNVPPLGTGASYTQTAEVTLPRGIAGDFFIHIFANSFVDAAGRIVSGRILDERFAYEAGNTANNRGSALLPITYTEPDLRVRDLSVSNDQPVSGETISATWTVTNIGTRDTRETLWRDAVWLSRDPSLDRTDISLGGVRRSGALPCAGGTPLCTANTSQDASYMETLDVEVPIDADGDYYLLVFTDPTLSAGGVIIKDAVPEFQGEGNNITPVPLTVTLNTPPDLQVFDSADPQRSVDASERVTVGQFFDVTYSVTNRDLGGTPAVQSRWADVLYLSRDTYLDPRKDIYLGSETRTGGLAAGESYTITRQYRAPRHFDEMTEMFVIVQTDRLDAVFEGAHENNNTTASFQPLIIELPPAGDLQVDAGSITVPAAAQSGSPITVQWSVTNQGQANIIGEWSDAVYLSTDGVWDIGDTFLGRAPHTTLDTFQIPAVQVPLEPGDSYTSTLTAKVPPVLPGQYRIIVRSDIFDEVYEGTDETNNRRVSAGTVELSDPQLQIGIPLETALNSGEERLFEIVAGDRQTLEVTLTTDDQNASNELFLRFNDIPGIQFDAASQDPLAANQRAVIPSTEPGTYYLLVRPHFQPDPNTPVTLFADALPLTITDVFTDVGGDSRYVTTTIRGAQFDDTAIVKLVRPGFAEFEPARYEVIDSTKIIAIFDLTDAPHGLYDVKVINPDGEEAVLPYRYLVERFIEPDVTIGMGGPRVISPGDTGLYGVSVQSLTNIDTPYVFFEFGLPELGRNREVFDFDYIQFRTNLRGQPDLDRLDDVPWASLQSEVNRNGELLAPGYVLDLPTGGFAGLNFTAETYPGLKELIDPEAAFEALRQTLYARYPNTRGLLDNGPEGLNDIVPGLTTVYEAIRTNPLFNPLEGLDPFQVCFQFPITAAATSLTRQEFIDQQTAEALRLRNAILADSLFRVTFDPGLAPDLDNREIPDVMRNALPSEGITLSDDASVVVDAAGERWRIVDTSQTFVISRQDGELVLSRAFDAGIQNLVVLAADQDLWVSGYLAALEEAGLLRPVDGTGHATAPPIRELPQVVSLIATLDTGLLAGPAGDQIITDGNLLDFFTQVRRWYGHVDGVLGTRDVPDRSEYDLSLLRPTHFEAFNIFVPFGNSQGSCRLDIPPSAPIQPPDFSRFFSDSGVESDLIVQIGPFGVGDEQFVPVGHPLPYTIQFENDPSAVATASEVRIVSTLDDHLDPRSFRLGDLEVGDIQVHVPAHRANFQGDFDFTASKGFILRVIAGIDVTSSTATWLLQAIDPDTGELISDPDRGLLPPNTVSGTGNGFVTYSVLPDEVVSTGDQIEATARVILDTSAPTDAAPITNTIDAFAPTTTLAATPLVAGGSNYDIRWTASDDAGGSGVKHVTVYVAEDGGDLMIWQRQSTETSDRVSTSS